MKIVLLTLAACLMGVSLGWATDYSVTATPIADVTVTTAATLVRAYTSTRFALSCTNQGTDAVRWGSSAVAATTGQRIPSGASIQIVFIGAVYMIAETSTATISCTEEKR